MESVWEFLRECKDHWDLILWGFGALLALGTMVLGWVQAIHNKGLAVASAEATEVVAKNIEDLTKNPDIIANLMKTLPGGQNPIALEIIQVVGQALKDRIKISEEQSMTDKGATALANAVKKVDPK